MEIKFCNLGCGVTGIKNIGNVIFLYGDQVSERRLPFGKQELAYLKQARNENKESQIRFDRLPYHTWIQNFDSEKPSTVVHEQLRKSAASIQQQLSDEKQKEVFLMSEGALPEDIIAFVEGLVMANYRFDKYKSKKDVLVETLWIVIRDISPIPAGIGKFCH